MLTAKPRRDALHRIEGEILIPHAAAAAVSQTPFRVICQCRSEFVSNLFLSRYRAPSHFGILFQPLEIVGEAKIIYISLLPPDFPSQSTLCSLTQQQFLMRFAQFTTIFRTLGLFSTFSRPQATRILSRQPAFIKSMPSFPLFSNLFGSSNHASSNMSYPDQRSQDEWRAVLNPGTYQQLPFHQRKLAGEFEQQY